MSRPRLLLYLFLLCFGAIVARLFYWQIVRGPTLAQAASDQYYSKLTVPPIRGDILAADDSPLVSNKKVFLAYAQPQIIADKSYFADKIAPLLNLKSEDIQARLVVPEALWVPILHKIEPDIKKQLEALNLKGLGFEAEGSRAYPEGSMAAHLMGFVGKDQNGEDIGYFGLEGFYNQALSGKSGTLIQEKDARGLPIVLGYNKRIPAQDGQTLGLHIDRTVQLIAEEKLKNGIEKYGAKSGIVAILNPKTGGVLASATYPSYDPYQYSEFDNEAFNNPLVSMTYEPGSTFKTLVMAAAINEKVITPNTVYNENGPVRIGEYSIKTWNDQYHGDLTMTEVLEKSSNPGMVYVGKLLGKDRLYSYIQKFGFGTRTGIDVQGEEEASLRPLKDWYEIDGATATFGQGIAVTPIQMLRAVATIANRGQMLQPALVAQIRDLTGKKIITQPKKVRQVISEETARTMTQMMVAAADHGDAQWAKVRGYRIAGKTGTAQIPIAGHYDEKKTIASFVGFAPADDPKFAMLVLLREPSTSQWGSETAAPLFFSITKELFTYYGISPKD